MTKRVLPAEATEEMEVELYRVERNDAQAKFDKIIAAAPAAGKVTEADLNALAAAIKKASSERRYGKYDYSEYPGKEPPFVVRDERTGDAVFRSWSCDEVEREYARLCDEHIARTALSVLGLEVK